MPTTSSDSLSSPQENHETTAPQPTMPQPAAMPPLFAVPTQLIGWQGTTITVPAEWNFVQFGGDHTVGHFSLTDDDGPRLELRWEKPERSVDIEKSVTDFVERIGRDIKKQKQPFEALSGVHLLSKSRKRKAQLASFGWKSEGAATLGQGYGVAWQCEKCGRVVVSQIIGRGGEKPGKLQALASEVFASLECHGSGGWETWSVFGLRVEIPEEFRLAKSRLLTGRIEFDWVRGEGRGPLSFFSRDERLSLSRHALANVLMQNESLHDWLRRVVMTADKRTYYRALKPSPLPGSPALRGKPPRDVKTFSDQASRVLAEEAAHDDDAPNETNAIAPENALDESQATSDDAVQPDDAANFDDAQAADTLVAHGFLRDVRRVAVLWLLDKVLRRRALPIELRAWHSDSVNKIFVLRSELSPANTHVTGDVIDSLDSN